MDFDDAVILVHPNIEKKRSGRKRKLEIGGALGRIQGKMFKLGMLQIILGVLLFMSGVVANAMYFYSRAFANTFAGATLIQLMFTYGVWAVLTGATGVWLWWHWPLWAGELDRDGVRMLGWRVQLFILMTVMACLLATWVTTAALVSLGKMRQFGVMDQTQKILLATNAAVSVAALLASPQRLCELTKLWDAGQVRDRHTLCACCEHFV
jgi:hypothetical protein